MTQNARENRERNGWKVDSIRTGRTHCVVVGERAERSYTGAGLSGMRTGRTHRALVCAVGPAASRQPRIRVQIAAGRNQQKAEYGREQHSWNPEHDLL
jgi:hypothetical protein